MGQKQANLEKNLRSKAVTPRPKELGVIAGAQGTDKERLLAKDLAERHRDELTPHQKERYSKTMQV